MKLTGVTQAFSLAKLETLPRELRHCYEEEDYSFDRYSHYTEQIAAEAAAKATAKAAAKVWATT